MYVEVPEYAGPLAFFKRHYNGDYSLGRSYWVNNTLVAWFAPLLGLLLLPWLSENFASRYASMGVVLITTFGVVAWFWAVAGTWASASKHVQRGGTGFWANAAKVIESHGLNTYVESHCASACTIAFLAGLSRAADPASKIGFHSLAFVGGNKSVMTKDEGDATMAAYAKAGLPQAFIKKIVSTPSDQMWYPTHDEMLRAGVFTRKSLGGESAALASLVKTYPALDAEFRKVPLFALIADKQADSYKRILDSAWAMVEQGKSDADVITAARAEVTVLAGKLIPLASNETLAAYSVLLYEQISHISKLDSKACVELIFPSGAGINTASFLSKELQKRELDLMFRVVNEADASRVIKVTDKQVDAVVGPLLEDMSEAELAAVASKEARDKDLNAACSAGVKYLGAINRLPVADKARTMRVLYSGN